MKTSRILPKVSVLLLLSTLVFSSCKKTVVGPQGETGQTGQTGATGNANVKAHLVSTTCVWKADSTELSYSYRMPMEDLDMTMLTGGLVSVYLGSSCECEWTGLPFQTKKQEYTFSVQLSNVVVKIRSLNGNMPEYPGIQKFKLVLIPPAK